MGAVDMKTKEGFADHDMKTVLWNDRLENIGWGLFLIVVGITFLWPDVEAPLGIWLIGAGLILLGLNAVRYLSSVKTSGFTIGLGSVALVAGIVSPLSVKIAGALLILIGASIILRPLFEKEGAPAGGAPAPSRNHAKEGKAM